MQGRTGACRVSYAFSGFTVLWQSEWASLAPVCVTPFQYGSQQHLPGRRENRCAWGTPRQGCRTLDGNSVLHRSSFGGRGLEPMRHFVSETTSAACFKGCLNVLGA